MYEIITIFLCTKIQFLYSIQKKKRKLQLTVFIYSISGEKTMVEDPIAPMQIVITITVKDSEGRPLIGAAVDVTPVVEGGISLTKGPRGEANKTVSFTASAAMSGYKSKSGEPVVNNGAIITLEAE